MSNDQELLNFEQRQPLNEENEPPHPQPLFPDNTPPSQPQPLFPDNTPPSQPQPLFPDNTPPSQPQMYEPPQPQPQKNEVPQTQPQPYQQPIASQFQPCQVSQPQAYLQPQPYQVNYQQPTNQNIYINNPINNNIVQNYVAPAPNIQMNVRINSTPTYKQAYTINNNLNTNTFGYNNNVIRPELNFENGKKQKCLLATIVFLFLLSLISSIACVEFIQNNSINAWIVIGIITNILDIIIGIWMIILYNMKEKSTRNMALGILSLASLLICLLAFSGIISFAPKGSPLPGSYLFNVIDLIVASIYNMKCKKSD